MSLNPFGGMGRGILGGWVGRALGLGSNNPIIQGIMAFGMIVALGLFIVHEYYEIQAARLNAKYDQRTFVPGTKMSEELRSFCKENPGYYMCGKE